MNRVYKSLVLILCMFSSFQAFSRGGREEEKYFIFNSEKRVDFLSFDHLTIDSLYIRNNNFVSYVLLDSIIEYHHYRPGKKVKGLLIGAASGVLLGAVIGSIISPPVDNSNLGTQYLSSVEKTGYGAMGALLGLPIGGLLGYSIGADAGENIHVDFRIYKKQSKQLYFQNLLNE